MKKFFPLLFISLFALVGCGGESGGNTPTQTPTPTPSPEKIYYSCDIKFFNDLQRKPEHEIAGTEFKIDTNIYVQVDFNFYNLDNVEDVIDYQVDIKPGFDTYSVADYTRGAVEPTVPAHEVDFTEADDKSKIIEISGMKFAIKKEIDKYHYVYVFTIRGQKAEENCYFKSIFRPQDNFGGVNGKNFTRKVDFKFVELKNE